MTEENEEDYMNDDVCRFFEKEKLSDKVGDHCHLTSKYRCPPHSICNNNVTQKQSNSISFVFHKFSHCDCHMFFKKLVNKKDDKVKFDTIPTTNEEYISVTDCCIRFIDSYRFLSSSLDKLVKTLVDNSHKTLKEFEAEIVDNDEVLGIVNETKITIEEDKYKSDSIKELKKILPDKNEKLEETLPNYTGENDLKTLKSEFPDKRKNSTKILAYPFE